MARRSMSVFVSLRACVHTSGFLRHLSAPGELAGDFSLTGCVLRATFECQEWQLGGWAAMCWGDHSPSLSIKRGEWISWSWEHFQGYRGWEEPGPGTTRTWVSVLSWSCNWLGDFAQVASFPLASGCSSHHRAAVGMKWAESRTCLAHWGVQDTSFFLQMPGLIFQSLSLLVLYLHFRRFIHSIRPVFIIDLLCGRCCCRYWDRVKKSCPPGLIYYDHWHLPVQGSGVRL